MKLIKHLLTALFVLTVAHVASAQTVVRISGAQAFGDAAHRAIAHILGAVGGAPYVLPAGSTYAYTGTDINKAQQSIWTGFVGGSPVIIKTSWNGSTEGIRVVSRNVNVNFLVDATTQSVGGTQLPTTGNTTEAQPPDAAAVDSFQNSTIWTSTPPLVDKLVGAGAYVFVASKEAPATLNNITTQQAQALYSSGQLPLAVFTGLASDRTTNVTSTWGGTAPVQVFATGRDYGSGARIIAFIESGIGANANVQQFKPVISGGNVTTHDLYPATTINGIFFPAGSDGNTSNGNLATTVLNKNTLAGIGGYYISYLPTLDAANAVAAGAHALAYNGVPYTPENVSEGSYSLWAYEHILYKSTLSTPQKNLLDAFATQLTNVDATLLLSSLQVSRPIDGGAITNTY